MGKQGAFNRRLIGKLELRDVIAALLMLLLFGAQAAAAKIFAGSETGRILFVVAYMAACIAFTAFMFRDKLKDDWKSFCSRWWLYIPLAVGCALLMLYVLLPLARTLMGFGLGDADAASVLLSAAGEGDDFDFGPESMMSFMTAALMGSIPAILAPFMEEIVFRHILFYKWRDGKIAAVMLLLASSFLFGAMHVGNFGGNFIQTVPYMFMGLFLALIYRFTKNVWCNMCAHFVLNFVNSTGMILLSMLMLLFSER